MELNVGIEGEAKVEDTTLDSGLGEWIDGDGEQAQGKRLGYAGCRVVVGHPSGESIRMYESGTQKSKYEWYVKPRAWLGVPRERAQLVTK